ncbi:MAG: gamma carbonic anhydrase family protein [Thermodesulfobacteriota bacterium]
MLIPYCEKIPKIGKNVFIAPTAVIIGDVVIRDNASVWFNTVIRGDLAGIVIGENTNIQDNCTVHTDHDKPAVIGSNVTVGHNAVIHGCTIEDDCLIGIQAVILNEARVKKGTVVAAASLVKEGQHVGPFQLVAGVPAVVKRSLSEELVRNYQEPVHSYLKLAAAYQTAAKGG